MMRSVVEYIQQKKAAGKADPESGYEDQYHFNKWLGTLRRTTPGSGGGGGEPVSVDRQRPDFATKPHCFDYSGLTFFIWHHLEFSNGMHKHDPTRRYVLHANMVQGVHSKRQRLINDKLWHGDDI